MGPYRIEHVDIASVSVYTNNGMSGEFRGFGAAVIFALEGQIEQRKATSGCSGISPGIEKLQLIYRLPAMELGNWHRFHYKAF